MVVAWAIYINECVTTKEEIWGVKPRSQIVISPVPFSKGMLPSSVVRWLSYLESIKMKRMVMA